MTDLQILVRQTSNPSILKMQQRLHDEVVSLGKQALEWKANCEALQLALEVERDAANLYAKQVAHWIEKHDALLDQQLAAEDRAQRDADPLAELRAYALTVANLREQLAQRGEPVAWMWRFPDGDLSESPFESRSECERDAVGYDGEAIPLYTHPQAPREQLMDKEHQDSWNHKCRLVVDTLLHEAGYHEDSSVRHNLAMMNFDASPAAVEQLAQQAPQVPMTEDEIVMCLVESSCIGKVMMSFESGPYDITRTSINADRLVRAIEAHHNIKEKP